jgi:pimeloyl-ACP methyl ester carboxylesterase
VTLLFVNPVVYGLEVFQPIVERLCREFRFVTIDPRGTGASDPLQRPYGLSQHVLDVRAVIEQARVGAVTGSASRVVAISWFGSPISTRNRCADWP